MKRKSIFIVVVSIAVLAFTIIFWKKQRALLPDERQDVFLPVLTNTSIQNLNSSTNVLFNVSIDPVTKSYAVLSADNIFAVKELDGSMIWSVDISAELCGSHPNSMKLYGNQICIGTDYLKMNGLQARDGGFILDLTSRRFGFLYR